MPQDTKPSFPTPSKHVVRGIPYARVRIWIDGKRRQYNLGRWGTAEADAEYRRVKAEHAGTRRAPTRRSGARVRDESTTTIAELCLAYLEHRKTCGVTSRTLDKCERPALRRLRRLYGHTLVVEFSPKRFRALLAATIKEGPEKGRGVGKPLSRTYVNQKIIPIIKRMFRWGVVNELVPTDVHARISAVESLRPGELETAESAPVNEVADEIVEATLPHLPPIVADMVRVQRLTAMRPGEVCVMRWADVATSEAIWEYRPAAHKTAYRGHERRIQIPKSAQAVLMKYRARDVDAAIFSPAEALKAWRDEMRQRRKTPVQPSQIARTERARKRQAKRLTPGTPYTVNGYAEAIARGVKRAFRPDGMDDEAFAEWKPAQHWHPNQLRHAAVTEIERTIGREAASAFAGHRHLKTTTTYAHGQRLIAMDVAKKIG